jgi:hypothetical protein
LVWGGRTKEADMMMDYCVENFLQANGDFALTSSSGAANFAPLADKTLHWEFYDFYAYLNQWWITAGIRLSRFDFVPAAYEYCKANWYNPAAQAGILQAPIDSNYENCIFTSGIASQWSVLPASQSCVLCCWLRFLTHLSAVATDRCPARCARACLSLPFSASRLHRSAHGRHRAGQKGADGVGHWQSALVTARAVAS